MLQKNVAAWFEIPASDLERAVGFYEKLLETKLQQMTMGPVTMGVFPYEMGFSGGAVVKTEGVKPASQGSVVYLNVADIRPILSRVEDVGGKVLQPLTELPGDGGVFATFRDSEGNRVGLYSAA